MADKHRTGLVILRVVAAALMIIHGVSRIQLGLVDDFGAFFTGMGWPFGEVLAWTVTVLEIGSGLLLALGIWSRWMASYQVVHLIAGIVLVHGKEGWFVVGSGRNGVEYSVLLIVVFLVIAYTAPPRKRRRRY